MEQLLTNILTNLIQLAVLGGFGALIKFLITKCGNANVKKAYNFAKIAVQAAEQQFGSGKGADKKKYAEDFLISKGIPKDMVDKMIESAVKEFINVLQNTGLETAKALTSINKLAPTQPVTPVQK